VDAQTNLRALTARDSSMAQTQQGCVPNSTDSQSCWLSTIVLPLVQINRDKLQQLVKAQQELSLEIARGFDWQALEEPQLGLQMGPNIKLNLLLGLVVGLMLLPFYAK